VQLLALHQQQGPAEAPPEVPGMLTMYQHLLQTVLMWVYVQACARKRSKHTMHASWQVA
jgi:hypothetical protein